MGDIQLCPQPFCALSLVDLSSTTPKLWRWSLVAGNPKVWTEGSLSTKRANPFFQKGYRQSTCSWKYLKESLEVRRGAELHRRRRGRCSFLSGKKPFFITFPCLVSRLNLEQHLFIVFFMKRKKTMCRVSTSEFSACHPAGMPQPEVNVPESTDVR